MTPPTDNPWLNRLAILTAAATLFLICVGGLVTSHGVGMSVPDWPTTYGYNMFFFPFSKWVGGIFYEHSHRLVASVVGMLTAVLAAWLWLRHTQSKGRWIGLIWITMALALVGVRTKIMFIVLACAALSVIAFSFWRMRADERPIRWWGMIAFCVVLIQGVLGGLRVTELKDEIGIFHAILAQLFFVLISAIALWTSRWWKHAPKLVIYDGNGLRYESPGFIPAEFTFQRIPLIDFFDGVSQIDRRVDEKKLIDADLALVSVDNAKIRAFKPAQTDRHEIDRRGLDVVPISQDGQGFLHDFI